MNDRATIHVGDALAVLRTMPSESVHCCVTSPPYWGLRDYGVAGQIGLESSLSEFLAKLVAVFEEVRRVLRRDGTCWVNMGDCYLARPNVGTGWSSTINGKETQQQATAAMRLARKTPASTGGLKAKDKIGQPWRLAFALQEAGWYLRQDIIWHKPNPMPESAKDRPTTAHEYLFLLTKSPRYFYDAAAIREQVSGGAHSRGAGLNPKAMGKAPTGWAGKGENRQAVLLDRGRARVKQNASMSAALSLKVVERRNKRSVWTLCTRPFRGAHFATFPPDLVRPCILAGCPEGGLVLDPFAGSGTTGVVSIEHGRRFVGIELSPTYAEMAQRRLDAVQTRIPGVA